MIAAAARLKKKETPRWSEYLSAQAMEVHNRLANWARWGYERIGSPSHCGSVEHKFVPGRDDERAEKVQRECSEGVDALDAEEVEACVVALPKQSMVRLFLFSYYIRRNQWRVTCRILRIHPDLFPSAHVRAISVVSGLLHAAREGASHRG